MSMMKWHTAITALDTVEASLLKIHSKLKPGRLKDDIGAVLGEMRGLRMIINHQASLAASYQSSINDLVIQVHSNRAAADNARMQADSVVRANMATKMADTYGVSYQQARLVLDAIVGDGTIDPGDYYNERITELLGDLGDFLDYEDAG